MKTAVTIIVHGVGAAWPCGCRRSFCPSCSGTDLPAAGWGNTSFSLFAGNPGRAAQHVVIDVGSGCGRGIQAAQLPAPKTIFLTHGHLDHLNLMELSTLLTMATMDQSREPIRIVATRHTWNQIPAFLQAQFTFVEAVPGRRDSLVIEGEAIQFQVIDASDHFVGAVMYIIELMGVQSGFLFDKRTWSTIETDILEGLDFAFLEANTLRPMSSRTSHVSLAEDLQMLRSLRTPPRTTFFFHYGHDEEERLSLGDRILQLAAVAPDLCVRWAHAGMSVSSQYLPPRNSVAVMDADTQLVIGAGEKTDVHAEGVLHAAVSVLCTTGDGLVLTYRRHPRQDQGNRWDINGGHMHPWSNPRQTAMREAREEVRLTTPTGWRLQIEDAWFQTLGQPFDLPCHSPRNRELGSLMGLTIPHDVLIDIVDELNDGTEVKLEQRFVTLADLLALRKESPDSTADGLGRLLDRIQTDRDLLERIQTFLIQPLPK